MASSTNTDGCERGDEVGAYATGALGEAERERAEAHFVACSRCRRALAAYIRFVAAADIDMRVDAIDPQEIGAIAAATLPRARALVRAAIEPEDDGSGGVGG